MSIYKKQYMEYSVPAVDDIVENCSDELKKVSF